MLFAHQPVLLQDAQRLAHFRFGRFMQSEEFDSSDLRALQFDSAGSRDQLLLLRNTCCRDQTEE